MTQPKQSPRRKPRRNFRRKCYVFWPYDIFPHLLGAIGEWTEDGAIHIPSYQMTLRGVAPTSVIHDLKAGKAFKWELDRMREARLRVIEEVDRGYANQVKSLRLAIARCSNQELK